MSVVSSLSWETKEKKTSAAAASVNEGRFSDTEKAGLSLTMTLLALPQPGKGQVTEKVNIDFSSFGFVFIPEQLLVVLERAKAWARKLKLKLGACTALFDCPKLLRNFQCWIFNGQKHF